MAAKEKIFYVQLGRRIAELRKVAGITQVELAEILGVAQQTMAHYEGGVSRIAVALLPPLAKALDTTIEELTGEDSKRGGKRGPASKHATTARPGQPVAACTAEVRQPDARHGVATGDPLGG